jgi:hypothetical protein
MHFPLLLWNQLQFLKSSTHSWFSFFNWFHYVSLSCIKQVIGHPVPVWLVQYCVLCSRSVSGFYGFMEGMRSNHDEWRDIAADFRFSEGGRPDSWGETKISNSETSSGIDKWRLPHESKLSHGFVEEGRLGIPRHGSAVGLSWEIDEIGRAESCSIKEMPGRVWRFIWHLDYWTRWVETRFRNWYQGRRSSFGHFTMKIDWIANWFAR